MWFKEDCLDFINIFMFICLIICAYLPCPFLRKFFWGVILSGSETSPWLIELLALGKVFYFVTSFLWYFLPSRFLYRFRILFLWMFRLYTLLFLTMLIEMLFKAVLSCLLFVSSLLEKVLTYSSFLLDLIGYYLLLFYCFLGSNFYFF